MVHPTRPKLVWGERPEGPSAIPSALRKDWRFNTASVRPFPHDDQTGPCQKVQVGHFVLSTSAESGSLEKENQGKKEKCNIYKQEQKSER